MTHYDYGYDDANTPFGEKGTIVGGGIMGKWSHGVLGYRSLASDIPALQYFITPLFQACFLCFLVLTPALLQGQEEKVKIGLLMINADAGIFIGKERGYFRDQGISAELIFFSSSGGPQMAALTTGELARISHQGSCREVESMRL